MPDRIIRAGIITSDPVNTLSWAAEVFYRRLMSVVDDYGRYDGRTSVIRGTVYPLILDRAREADIVTWIGECRKAGLVRLYTVEGKPYLEMVKFGQRIQAKSKWPDPPESRNGSDSPKPTVNHRESPPYSYSDSNARTKSDTHTPSVRGASEINSAMAKDGFPEAWQRWREYRADINEPMSSHTARAVMLKCERWGPKKSKLMIDRAIENGWKNLREDAELNYGHGGKSPDASPKPAAPSKFTQQVADVKRVLTQWEEMSESEQSMARNFLKTLTDTAIQGYFPKEQAAIREIIR